ncbi:MAG: dienelactone hydrolase family protein [Sphingomonas sp.]
MSERRLRDAIALYDRFTHEGMDRRVFMTELTRIAGGAAAASLMLSGIAANAQATPQVAADDARLRTRNDELRFDGHYVRAYRAIRRDLLPRPGRSRPPTVIVIHENRGLNDHIRDVTRRAALAGYDALAPDFLSLGGDTTPADQDAARTAIRALDMDRAVATGTALVRLFHAPQQIVRPFETQPTPVGLIGFCWGGAMVNRLAVAAGDALAAAVPFYGPAPDPAEAQRVEASMLIVLAGLDDRVNATGRPWAEALRAAGRTVELREFPDVDHAFHNDTSAQRYNAEAAGQAWAATIDFFRRHLRA